MTFSIVKLDRIPVGDLVTPTICGRLIESSEPNHATVTHLNLDLDEDDDPIAIDFQHARNRKFCYQHGVSLKLGHIISATGHLFVASWLERLPHQPPRAWFARCHGVSAAAWLFAEVDWQWRNHKRWLNPKTGFCRYEAETSAQRFLSEMAFSIPESNRIRPKLKVVNQMATA